MRARIFIIDGDDGALGGREAAFLNRGVCFHCAVPVEMIRRDVEKHAD